MKFKLQFSYCEAAVKVLHATILDIQKKMEDNPNVKEKEPILASESKSMLVVWTYSGSRYADKHA